MLCPNYELGSGDTKNEDEDTTVPEKESPRVNLRDWWENAYKPGLERLMKLVMKVYRSDIV